MTCRRRNASSPQTILRNLRILVGSVLAALAASCAAFDPTPQCVDNTVPPWWSNYRVDGLERGKITGAGSERRSSQEEAKRAAMESAEREMSAWLNRLFHRVTTEYATERERNNSSITPQRVFELVEKIVAPYIAKSTTMRDESIFRCDGKFEAYVLVEINVDGVSADVTQHIIEELSGEQAYRSAATVRALERKLKGELMKLIPKKPTAPEQSEESILVWLSSSPAGAEVWIAGSRRCASTPCPLKLQVGSYPVKLRKTGYATLMETFDVSSGIGAKKWTLSPAVDRLGGEVAIAVGGSASCMIQAITRNVVCWGANYKGTAPPPSVNGVEGTATAIAVGGNHSCAIQSGTGNVVCWGKDDKGQATPPSSVNGDEGTALSIAAGLQHNCAIQATTGNVVCWGNDHKGQSTPPSFVNGNRGTATAIAAGGFHSCAIQANRNKVVCWGYDGNSRVKPPDSVNGTNGGAAAIAAGIRHSCAIQAKTGKVVCWGSDSNEQATPPSSVNGIEGTAMAIAAGGLQSCALEANTGKVVCWGSDGYGEGALPNSVNGVDGTANAIAVGGRHSCALEANSGDVVCWGNDKYGQATPPTSIKKNMLRRERDVVPSRSATSRDRPLAFIGIKKGDSEHNVISIYGKPRRTTNGSYGKLMFYNGDVVFTAKNGRVTGVALYASGIATIRAAGTEDVLSGWVAKTRKQIESHFGYDNYGRTSSYATKYGRLLFWFEGQKCTQLEVGWD